MKQSDQELMAGIVRREEAAFDALVPLYGEVDPLPDVDSRVLVGLRPR